MGTWTCPRPQRKGHLCTVRLLKRGASHWYALICHQSRYYHYLLINYNIHQRLSPQLNVENFINKSKLPCLAVPIKPCPRGGGLCSPTPPPRGNNVFTSMCTARLNWNLCAESGLCDLYPSFVALLLVFAQYFFYRLQHFVLYMNIIFK